MKKFVLLLILAVFASAFSGCRKNEIIMKAENMNVEISLPYDDWDTIADDESSYIISNGTDMISCSITEISSDSSVHLPATEDELLLSFGYAVASVSKISDFSYEYWPDEKTQSLFYKQTINDGTTVSVIICKDTITDNIRTTTTATLINADEYEISKIEKSINEM